MSPGTLFGGTTLSDIELLPTESIRTLVDALQTLEIEFAIVGGVAVGFCSTPRFTADIDAVLLDIDERLEWIVERLAKFGYSARTFDAVTFASRTRIITLKDAKRTGIDLMMGLLPFDTALAFCNNFHRYSCQLDCNESNRMEAQGHCGYPTNNTDEQRIGYV